MGYFAASLAREPLLLGEGAAGASTSAQIRVVAKSFIKCIGLKLGTLPAHCYVLGGTVLGNAWPKLLALAATTDRMMCEDPMHDRKDKGYRLYSACTFELRCRDGALVDVVPSQLDTDSGKEGPLQAPGLIASSVSVTRSAEGFDFGWFARGRPHAAVEPGFQAVCPRSSLYIWHRVSGKVRCKPESGTFSVSASIAGSRFPSHRVFVNGSVTHSVSQQGFARLWHAAPGQVTRVE